MGLQILGDKKKSNFDDNLADYVNGIFDKMPDEVPEQEVVSSDFPFSVKDLLERGCDARFSFDLKGEKNHNLGYLSSLKTALKWAKEKNGVVASLPYLIAGLSVADENNFLKGIWHTAHSEENLGIDKEGKFFDKGTAVVVVVHGGGLLTPNRIERAYSEGLSEEGKVKFEENEFENLLKGILPSGERIKLYSVDDVKNGKVKNLFGRYGVVTCYKNYALPSAYEKKDFLNNELVIARAGTLEYLDKYFENVKNGSFIGKEIVYHYQSYKENNNLIPLGSGLYIEGTFKGIQAGNFLGETGRFVVVPQKENLQNNMTIIEG
ncbi:hypothetical protein HZA97_01185 [Candidatus Woesearchaeota archaeon]|nr:hypothetical protein [Candidatus Woesearchaeota archaeon]